MGVSGDLFVKGTALIISLFFSSSTISGGRKVSPFFCCVPKNGKSRPGGEVSGAVDCVVFAGSIIVIFHQNIHKRLS